MFLINTPIFIASTIHSYSIRHTTAGTSGKSATSIMDFTIPQSEVQELRFVLQRVTMRMTCNSSSECFHDTADGSDIDLMNLLLNKSSF